MDEEREFEWDEEKNRANLRKHNVDFEEASKVFLDDNRLEFEDDDPAEDRWNVIGFVGNTLPTPFAERRSASYRRERRNPMKEGNITRYRLDPNSKREFDWSAFDAMTEDEVHAAALSDPDAQPATEEQLARARRRPRVALIRQSLNLTQEEFARRFGLALGTVRDWEQGAHMPDRAALILLAIIARHPEVVEEAVLNSPFRPTLAAE